MYTIATIFTLAVAASATVTVGQLEAKQCGNTGKISCCNPGSGSIAVGGLAALSGHYSIAGGACQPLSASAAVLPVARLSICGSAIAYCCEESANDQAGGINLSTSCTPLDVAGLPVSP